MKEPDILLFHGRLVSPPDAPMALSAERNTPLTVIPDGAIVGRKGIITDIGPTQEVLSRTSPGPGTLVLDLKGRAVLPGLVDPHTHLLYAGDRMDEMEMRRRGQGYMEILKAGGGILKSMRDLREASSEELLEAILKRLRRLVLHGTVAVEVKSGYGLSLKEEVRSLEVIRKAKETTGLPLFPTLMGAHAFPPDVSREAHLKELDRMTDEVSRRSLAQFIDIFLEEGVFTPDEARRVLLRGREKGFTLKLHADELHPSGGAEVAAELGAISADHLTKATDSGLKAMAEAGVTAVILPGTSFFLRETPFPAEKARRLGLKAAIATDSNPGSSPLESMAMMMALAFHGGGFTPEEALLMATVNAAGALGAQERLGSLTVGKDFSVLVIDDEDPRALIYHPGSQLTWALFEGGRRLVSQGALTEEVLKWKVS